MKCGMQAWPLVVPRLIDHAARNFGATQIVTLREDGSLDRSNWHDVQRHAKQLAHALQRYGIRPGDRVATLAWNTRHHLECLYGIAGVGAIAHTVNPRLFSEQIVHIINDAEDRILFIDPSFVDLVAALAAQLPTLEMVVIFGSPKEPAGDMPFPVQDYTTFISAGDVEFPWFEADETAACGLCYTSGTTGRPKGVLYGHRSTVLHAMAAVAPDALHLSASSCALPVVPMYHANAWGLPYAAALAGAKLVLAGGHFDPPTLRRLIVEERVTMTAAVPTIWTAMLHHLDKVGENLGALERVVIGGSAAPRSMIETFQKRFGIVVAHAWGMTETSPLGTVASLGHSAQNLTGDEKLDLLCKQGKPIFGVELEIVSDDGVPKQCDGISFGKLLARGPWIVDHYFKQKAHSAIDGAGWFDTGDIATIDAHAFMQITDRAKDLIKSGGEWISSIELENAANGCPGVIEAAVIGIPHDKWDERPLLIIVREPGSAIEVLEIIDHLSSKVAKWWLPERVEFVDALPHTATGKIDKVSLRKNFAS